jgi:CHAD domain-containing protein
VNDALGSPPLPSPAEPRAGDFLAPVLSQLIATVRAAAARVGDHAADPEAVHDLRVALRRLRTVLRPARRLYGKRRLRAIGAELGGFARAAGALRDDEVLRETLTALELPAGARAEIDAWLTRRARRERAQRRRVASTIMAIEPPSLDETLADLERRLGRRPRERAAAALAEAALVEAAAGVEALASAHPADPAAMHALRIRYKRLRYTAELFAPLVGEGAIAVAREAARLQKRLGELHDLDEAHARTAQARGLSAATRAAVSLALERSRASAAERVRRALGHERAAYA